MIFGMVSIPKRVSEALKLYGARSNVKSRVVSIPKRVSEALKLAIACAICRIDISGFNP